VKKLNRHLEKILVREGIYISKIYICPHRPDENCRCRKPSPYFFEKAVSEFNLIREKCYTIGDKKSDLEAGAAAGIKSFLLGSDFNNLLEAAEYIAENESE
jgi:D-glycero-D-manno-heptose 1,7-bisphosphate phosphatase